LSPHLGNTGEKVDVDTDDSLGPLITNLLDAIHAYLFEKSKRERDDKIVTVTEWKDFVPALNRHCLVMTPFCDIKEWEEKVKVSSCVFSF
jgi:prolyl-tRNA synthetase